MNKQRAFTAIYAAVIITAAVLLTVIADKPIGSMAVTVPTMLVLFGSMLFRQIKYGVKLTECFIPMVCGLFFSSEYILLEYSIYDIAQAEIYPFSNVISGQLGNVLLCAAASLILILIKLTAKRSANG